VKLTRFRLCNFRSFGPEAKEIAFNDTTFLVGPNGAGKTAVMQALARMFSLNPVERRITKSDFHIPHDEDSEEPPASRTLWLEADFEFPELDADGDDDPAVATQFTHMQLVSEGGPAQVRYRLRAEMDSDEEIEERFTYVLGVDEDGEPINESRASKQERNAIQVHYLPARRDPADHISYSANALIGRALRAADWSAQRDQIGDLTQQISDSLSANGAIDGMTHALTDRWSALHKGNYFKDPSISFARSDIERLLRHLSIDFTPGHGETLVDFSRLSDGQQSLLYLSIVLGMHEIGIKTLAGELDGAFDVDKLRPAVFTLIAIEEPENSLSPHYLGRVVKVLQEFGDGVAGQAVFATHSPALMRRVLPGLVRYLRLDTDRTTVVSRIKLPPAGTEARKFVREAVQAFPELYFSRLVILGEGDSEEVVLPRILAARGILSDDASISVVPLGGRHVNHFWRLLTGLGIPYVTLLDLDAGRNQAGWARIRNAANKLVQYGLAEGGQIDGVPIASIPPWNSEDSVIQDDQGWLARLENHRVFFSAPLDLDFMMMTTFPEQYDVEEDDLEEPDEDTIKQVLGKAHGETEDDYTDDELSFFDAYHSRFQVGSKPSWHIQAMARLTNNKLNDDIPEVLNRLLDRIETMLGNLPE
jgi:putative ATP-dependent endonuclease of OLD family